MSRKASEPNGVWFVSPISKSIRRTHKQQMLLYETDLPPQGPPLIAYPLCGKAKSTYLGFYFFYWLVVLALSCRVGKG